MKKPVLFLCLAVLAGAQATAAGLSEAELGKALFFDTAFSLRRTMSCATCHDPANGFTDRRGLVPDRMVSLGDDGHSTGNRNAPTAAYANTSPMFHFDRKLKEYVGGQFLDGRAASLADQAMGPPLNALEMGLPDATELVRRLLEYEQIKLGAAGIDRLPVLGRDFLRAQVTVEQSLVARLPDVSVVDLREAWGEILKRARLNQHHTISREQLSVREHMSIVLRTLQGRKFVEFEDLFDVTRGVPVLIVTFIAMLELAKESLIEVTQAEAFAPIYVRLAYSPA